jgi:GT2 family glycosyltransferase
MDLSFCIYDAEVHRFERHHASVWENGSIAGGGRAEDSGSGIPLVSIVVVVFQSLPELRMLLDNLRSQELTDTEVVVVDGGSSDGTVEYLTASNDVVDIWMSEPDGGIYDAMNKGILAARGSYVLHLNAGDTLLYLPLDALRECLKDGVDVASFAVLDDGVKLFRPRSGFRTRIENTWHHQGTFYRREAHLLYDPSYRVYGDFELNQRMRRAGCTVRFFPDLVAGHTSGGASSALMLTRAHRREIWKIVREHSGRLHVPPAFLKLHLYLILQRLKSWVKRG